MKPLKQWNIIITFVFILMITLDFILTDIALHGGGFYETNRFTNTFGVEAHALILILVVLFGSYYYEKKSEVRILMNTACVLWILNNAVSIWMLAKY